MDSFVDMLVGTPFWVWLLLIFLLVRGVQAARPNILKPWRLAILPLIFTLLGVYGLATMLQGLLPWVIWFGFLLMSCPIGVLMVHSTEVRADHIHQLIGLPGSWSTLILILCIFSAKYAIGYAMAVQPELAKEVWFLLVNAGTAGTVVGLFIGRFVGLIRKYRAAPSENLLNGKAA